MCLSCYLHDLKILTGMDKRNKSDKLIIANKELVYKNEEKDKRAAELVIADKELVFQKNEKEINHNNPILSAFKIELLSLSCYH